MRFSPVSSGGVAVSGGRLQPQHPSQHRGVAYVQVVGKPGFSDATFSRPKRALEVSVTTVGFAPYDRRPSKPTNPIARSGAGEEGHRQPAHEASTNDSRAPTSCRYWQTGSPPQGRTATRDRDEAQQIAPSSPPNFAHLSAHIRASKRKELRSCS